MKVGLLGLQGAVQDHILHHASLGAEHMIENGNIQAAHNKLLTILKKTDGNPNLEDFVTGTSAESLATLIENLIESLDSI